MQAAAVPPSGPASRFHAVVRGLAWFLLIPLSAVFALAATAWYTVQQYERQHAGRIFTGVHVWDVDLSGLTAEEAAQRLAAAGVAAPAYPVTLVEPTLGLEQTFAARDLGVSLDVERTLALALAVGRAGEEDARLRDRWQAWYFGRAVSPQFIVDQARLDAALNDLAATLDRAPINAALEVAGAQIDYHPAQEGVRLDRAAARADLLGALVQLEPARIALRLQSDQPRIGDLGASAAELQQIISAPLTLYLEKPLDGADLQPVTLTPAKLMEWLRIEYAEQADGRSTPTIALDETAARAWLDQFVAPLAREPQRARFYFDDFTGELVLVEPHQNGRYLDVDASLTALQTAMRTPNRSLPFVVRDIVPAVHSGATGEELGITELVVEATTSFAGSPPERMHNIARSAANFYGIVLGPGEQFSFNRYLGEISEEQGYTRGLIIIGGRTIEGIGGGVCQVSTTVFQAAFVGGFQIDERWQHGYRVQYYETGLGVGLDATVYSPEIDFRFTNDTPYHLLIENYYNEATQSLTFKFYSTSMGRRVEWTTQIWGQTPARPDIYEYNPELEGNQLEQVDWAVEGAKVLVLRTIYNRWDEVKLKEEPFFSDYVPWANIYQYGPDYVFPPPRPEPTPAPPPEGADAPNP